MDLHDICHDATPCDMAGKFHEKQKLNNVFLAYEQNLTDIFDMWPTFRYIASFHATKCGAMLSNQLKRFQECTEIKHCS